MLAINTIVGLVTEWQSGRASQASFPVSCAQVGCGQAIPGQSGGGSFGCEQWMNPLAPLQLGQVSTRQSVRALHDVSSRPEHGAGQAMAAQIGPVSWAGS